MLGTCLSLVASKSDMNHFTEEWERKYNHELMMASEDCVTCNALRPFGVEGKENSCISHCELLVPPGSPDSVCEERCSRLRRANNMTESPCMAMSLCPLPLPRSSIPQPSEPAVYLPLVTILEHGVSAAMAARVVHWAKRSHPGVLVYDLKLTKQVGRRGTWTDADTALETAFTTLSPLDVQIERACELLEEEGALADGFAMLAFGQAGLVARGIVQLCPEVPARVLATYDSPHGGDYGGEASASVYQEGDPYSVAVQERLAAAGYVRDPFRLEVYGGTSALARLNREGGGERASKRWKEREVRGLSHLSKLILLYGGPEPASEGLGSEQQQRWHRWEPATSAWFQTFHALPDRAGPRSPLEEGALEGVRVSALWKLPVYAGLGLEALDIGRKLVVEQLSGCTYADAEWGKSKEEVHPRPWILDPRPSSLRP